MPEQLWSDDPIDQLPADPSPEVDSLADRVEIERLCKMQVLVPAASFSGEVSGKLTTKFV